MPYSPKTSRQVAGSIVNSVLVCKPIPPASGHPLYPLPRGLMRSWRSLPPLTSKPLPHSFVTLCAQQVRRILATGINPDEEKDGVSVVVIIEARVLGLCSHTSSGGELYVMVGDCVSEEVAIMVPATMARANAVVCPQAA